MCSRQLGSPSRVIFVTQLFLQTLNIGLRFGLINFRTKFSEVSQDRNLAITHFNKPTVHCDVENCSLGQVHAGVIRNEGRKKRCVSSQERHLSTTKGAGDDLSCLAREQHSFWLKRGVLW